MRFCDHGTWKATITRRYRGKTVATYRQVAERYFEFLEARSIPFGSVTPQLLCDYLCALAARCRHLAVLREQYHCRADQFPVTPTIPNACGLACPAYERNKVDSYVATEKALARLFEHAERETDALPHNFFPEVRARVHETLKKRRLREREDARYPHRALTRDEISALFRVSQHARDRFIIALMFKTGIRHNEALLLPDGDALRESWARERIITVQDQGGIKRLGNPHLVIDDQLWGVLQEYLAWKDSHLRHAPLDDHRRAHLLLGKRGDRPLASAGMADLWASAGARAGIRISPLRDAPLTPHSARYTFCRLLEEAGFTPFWIARLRGDVQAPDAAMKSAWTYAKRAPEELREEYLARFPMLPM